ncbi:hypothetical protein [Carboxylicivirga taeanensis]|uniref:hypothetical protein n=1 Tax=Carboxylicivirga taeanensis TaxID=1416875 RepID=UPI003F6E29CD
MNHTTPILTSQHPAAFLMQQWKLFMNGVDRVLIFYLQRGHIEGLEWNQHMRGIISPLTLSEEAERELSIIIKERTAYQWLRPELLPFINKERLSINQLDLFSESLYLVLQVRNMYEEIPLISYLFFRDDCSNFGISNGQTQLETSHKAIIGNMATQFASVSLNNFYNVQHEASSFRQQTLKILEANQMGSDRDKDELLTWKNDWLDTYLLDLSKRDGVNYVISDAARTKLLTASDNYEISKEAIDNCIDYICKLYPVTPGDDLTIEAAYLMISPTKEQAVNAPKAEPTSRQSKVILLLDRLEEAAVSLYRQDQAITSAEVGANMVKPISAPAISDALRKNKVRILQLLEQYPQKWTTIRKHFKPIINLRAKKDQFLNASS